MSSTPYEPIGQSPAFLDLQERLARVAPIDRPVLLLGERGTGKEMAARKLHYLSKRWGNPFVTLHCAALSPTLIESELFGHESGAFTGARGGRKGRFESADKGSLFLDEISLIPMETQEKILRVVEYGSFERVGASQATEANVRIIGASNANLQDQANNGKFKRDLLDRLSFEVIFLPPLRERGEDIPLLTAHFASRMARELEHAEIPHFSQSALDALMQYTWPGNVRELKNVVERAVCRANGAVIGTVDFEPFRAPWKTLGSENVDRAHAVKCDMDQPTTPAAQTNWAGIDLFAQGVARALENGEVVALSELHDAIDAAALESALAVARYNQRAAAERLGLTYHQFRALYRKIKPGN
ncbi:TPA: phage shock protein operon transcriptional activator [Candidatus Sumerlaeota bacterium]|jgi:psp operon transcriptional activator|nr:phage shock protein operon transcriptional activator [Candidatus Sumerlaeota bacterium]